MYRRVLVQPTSNIPRMPVVLGDFSFRSCATRRFTCRNFTESWRTWKIATMMKRSGGSARGAQTCARVSPLPEVAAALEARLSTLQHLSPEEAATMLARMPPHQAGQLALGSIATAGLWPLAARDSTQVLLMGSGNRDRILAALSDTAKAAVAATLPADAAEALGLCATAASNLAEGCRQHHTSTQVQRARH